VSGGALDVVVAESLDRLSTLFKHLSFLGVRLWTVAEGQINELHVGLKGTMNALALKDLAQKTPAACARRGGPAPATATGTTSSRRSTTTRAGPG
jgi:hypothetical protein